MEFQLISALADLVAALTGVLTVLGLFMAIRQLQFQAWCKAQDLFAAPEFVEHRRRVLERLDHPKVLLSQWPAEDIQSAGVVCRRMDEFCHMAPFLGLTRWGGQRKMLKIWEVPIARTWTVLEPFVAQERKNTHFPNKWFAFSEAGEKAIRSLRAKGVQISHGTPAQ
jgi:hypothetical protein